MRAPKSPLGNKLTPVGILLTLIPLDLGLRSKEAHESRVVAWHIACCL